jgi:cobalt transporter subunit CbtA
MFFRVFTTALAAGALAGLFIFTAHLIKTEPMILQAEVYEQAATKAKHDHGAKSDGASKNTAKIITKTTSKTPQQHSEVADWGPSDGLERSFYTLVSDLLTSIGFAFLLVGAMALRGGQVDWGKGMIWGLGGFATFFAAPAFGLAPELPGMQAGDLQARQLWWLSTAAGTAAGLALMFFAGQRQLQVLGIAFLLLPHVIGAPGHELQPGRVPAELAAQFAITTMVISGLFWLILGALSGYFYGRFNLQR